MKMTKIIWIQDDDGSVDLDSIGVSVKDIMMADMVITDKGRMLKNRNSPSYEVSSFDLVKDAKPLELEPTKIKSKKTILKYRSIYDPSDIKDDL
jgi:hypothetical protein